MIKKLASLFCAALLALITSTALTLPALGADLVAASNTVVDFQPVLALIIAIIGAVIIAVLRPGTKALVAYLETKSGIELDASTRAYLQTAIDGAVSWATQKVGDGLKDKSVTLDVKSELVAHAADYLLDRVPDALEHFGLSAKDIEQLIEARLNQSLGLPPALLDPAAPVA